jgi:hypothetical protein
VKRKKVGLRMREQNIVNEVKRKKVRLKRRK